MKTDIILAGVGGQGILTIAATLGYAALYENLYVKQSEVHGMSQRGGAVQSHLRLSSKTIASDLIPKGSCDLILAVEPMESLRYLPYLAHGGWVVTNSVPFINITEYPDINLIQKAVTGISHHVWLNADQAAKEMKQPKSSNMIVLGAASPFLGLKYDSLMKGISAVFARKGSEIVEANQKAFDMGIKLSKT